MDTIVMDKIRDYLTPIILQLFAKSKYPELESSEIGKSIKKMKEEEDKEEKEKNFELIEFEYLTDYSDQVQEVLVDMIRLCLIEETDAGYKLSVLGKEEAKAYSDEPPKNNSNLSIVVYICGEKIENVKKKIEKLNLPDGAKTALYFVHGNLKEIEYCHHMLAFGDLYHIRKEIKKAKKEGIPVSFVKNDTELKKEIDRILARNIMM